MFRGNGPWDWKREIQIEPYNLPVHPGTSSPLLRWKHVYGKHECKFYCTSLWTKEQKCERWSLLTKGATQSYERRKECSVSFVYTYYYNGEQTRTKKASYTYTIIVTIALDWDAKSRSQNVRELLGEVYDRRIKTVSPHQVPVLRDDHKHWEELISYRMLTLASS